MQTSAKVNQEKVTYRFLGL